MAAKQIKLKQSDPRQAPPPPHHRISYGQSKSESTTTPPHRSCFLALPSRPPNFSNGGGGRGVSSVGNHGVSNKWQRIERATGLVQRRPLPPSSPSPSPSPSSSSPRLRSAPYIASFPWTRVYLRHSLMHLKDSVTSFFIIDTRVSHGRKLT